MTHIPFFEFVQLTKDLRALSEAQQIHALKRELFLALERALDNQDALLRTQNQLTLFRSESQTAQRTQQDVIASTQRELADARATCAELLAMIGHAAGLPDAILPVGAEPQEPFQVAS